MADLLTLIAPVLERNLSSIAKETPACDLAKPLARTYAQTKD